MACLALTQSRAFSVTMPLLAVLLSLLGATLAFGTPGQVLSEQKISGV
jgi:hypothetical protein